jgi:hypothetical protein
MRSPPCCHKESTTQGTVFFSAVLKNSIPVFFLRACLPQAGQSIEKKCLIRLIRLPCLISSCYA